MDKVAGPVPQLFVGLVLNNTFHFSKHAYFMEKSASRSSICFLLISGLGLALHCPILWSQAFAISLLAYYERSILFNEGILLSENYPAYASQQKLDKKKAERIKKMAMDVQVYHDWNGWLLSVRSDFIIFCTYNIIRVFALQWGL